MRTDDLKTGALLALLTASGLSACANSGPQNAGFDCWHEGTLCDWSTDEGSIGPTATWHPEDLAVSFLTTNSQISQRIEASPEHACFAVDTIADVVPEARLSLKLDFNDDETVDYEQQFADVGWKSVTLVIKAPASYESVRFIVRKEGEGRAALALLRVEGLSDCAGEPTRLRDGSSCTLDELCLSGHCRAGHCARLASEPGTE